MTDTTLQELMHAVLDGEASAAQARTLENALASDPAARGRLPGLAYPGTSRLPDSFPCPGR